MAKLNIDNDLLAESFFEDARILGIVAPLHDYQFIWNVNHRLSLQFRVNHSLEINMVKKKRTYFFSVFEYHIPHSALVYYLYNNQHDGEYLLPEFKHLDFLLVTKDEEISDEELAVLIEQVKQINGVQLVTELHADKIKNKQHLIL